MKIYLIIIFFAILTFYSCEENIKTTDGMPVDNSPEQIIDTASLENETIFTKTDETEKHTLFFPYKLMPIVDLKKKVESINGIVNRRQTNILEFFEFIDGPCNVEKHLYKKKIILIIAKCGDCSPVNTTWKYYFEKDTLICFTYTIEDYGYNPCFTEQECVEYGITDKYKKDHYQKRNDEYFFRNTNNRVFKRTGVFEHYEITNDTLSNEIILEQGEFLLRKDNL